MPAAALIRFPSQRSALARPEPSGGSISAAEQVVEPFSSALRAAIDDGHARARGSAFIAALLAGELDLAEYAALAAQQHVIRSALVAAGDAMRDHPVTAPWTPRERAELVAEAGVAFDHNAAALDDLAADLPAFRRA